MPCPDEGGRQPIRNRIVLGTGQDHAQSSVLRLLAQSYLRFPARSLDFKNRIKRYRASTALGRIDYHALVEISCRRTMQIGRRELVLGYPGYPSTLTEGGQGPDHSIRPEFNIGAKDDAMAVNRFAEVSIPTEFERGHGDMHNFARDYGQAPRTLGLPSDSHR
jgi:hypothetical protein